MRKALCAFVRFSRNPTLFRVFFLFPNQVKIYLMKIFQSIFCFSFFLAFLALLFPSALFAQNHQKIVEAVEQRNYAVAATELENLRNSDRTVFEANNYDYLLARVAERKGDLATAMANYQAVVNRNSILKEYALRHLAEIARESGNLMLERGYLQELSVFAPESLYAHAAKNRLARSFYESRNYGEAIRLLKAGQTINNNQPSAKSTSEKTASDAANRGNLALLAQAFLQNNQIQEARETFTKLTNNLPNPGQADDYALAGAKSLDLMDVGAERFGKEVPALTDYEHLRRASIYNFNRDFPAARLHYEAIIKNHPQSGIVPDAIYQIGRGWAQSGEFVEAIKWFERVQEQFPDHQVSKDALSQAASAYARVNKPREAVTRYQRFIQKYPDADNLERAYLNIADVYRDSGDNAAALKQTAKTQEAFRGKLPEALALFVQARIRFVQNDWQNAVADLEKLQNLPDLGGTRVAGGTNKAEVLFMKGFALENLERYPESIDVYLSIPDGRGEYYGWRATERLRLLANHDKAQIHVVKKLGELTASIETRDVEAQRKSAQAALRLSEAAQIRARMLEIIKKSYAALPEYQKVPTFKLLELGRREILREKRPNPPTNYHQAIADELLFLVLYDEAAPELEAAEKAKKGDEEKERRGEKGNSASLEVASEQAKSDQTKASESKKNETKTSESNPKSKIQNLKSNDFAYTLAVFYNRGDMAHRAVAFIEPFWRGVPADYEIELMPRDQIELLYPVPYADSLLRFAPERGVDPRFLLSIMRQESRYRPDVKSYAAARGLMQFISTTADRIAAQLDREDFRQDQLYHPPIAVLFGAQYVSNLFKEFPAQPQAVAGSYNGGEDNVRRWLARSKSTAPDRYVPEIVFSQSKDYIYKVMANYRVYQQFYDENLKLR
jgi:soluble lytic murein transglycosylase